MKLRRNPGPIAALAAALLFAIGTPAAKLLLGSISPWVLAGLLYIGSGVGLLTLRVVRKVSPPALERSGFVWLAAAVAFGGILGPVLLMWGLAHMTASGAALLLNAEGVFTALIAWFVFRENFDRRIVLGMLSVVAGALIISWPGAVEFGVALPALAVLGACLAWGIDNNLTRKIALADASYIAMVKGLAAGSTNLLLGLAAGASMPGVAAALAAGSVGFVSYGLSLVLFVLALRHLGAARTGAYFSTAPFAGAVLAILLLDEPITGPLLLGGAFMALGVWLHLTERHEHVHVHEALSHEHWHGHDEHHQHAHLDPVPASSRHFHRHVHEPLTHAHPHYPDAHHRHDHKKQEGWGDARHCDGRADGCMPHGVVYLVRHTGTDCIDACGNRKGRLQAMPVG
jgi:drug/metabolite transporter (DMT)-like permease